MTNEAQLIAAANAGNGQFLINQAGSNFVIAGFYFLVFLFLVWLIFEVYDFIDEYFLKK